MVSWRALGAGVLAFPAAVALTALSEPFGLLLVGFVPGAVAGTLAEPGGRAGLVHGLLVGGLCAVLFWALLLGWVTLSPPDRVAPGFGISVVLLGLFGLLAGIECVLGGLIVGIVRR